MSLIDVSNLTKNYVNGDVVTPVLRGVSFAIERGEFVAIMGPSGSGKSTLMHILSFLDTLTAGRYLFSGQNVSDLSDLELARMRNEKVGFVFQAFHLLPRTTVAENIELPLLYSAKQINKQMSIDAAIAAVGLEHRQNYLSNQLSGGEKQRVAIARAIVNNPGIIFADEPTGNLDSKSGNQILRILQNLNNNGHTIIMVTHEQDTANHAKRVLKIRDGQVVVDELVGERRYADDRELIK